MLTLDAWVSMLVLALCVGIALHPRGRVRANDARCLQTLGSASARFVDRWYWVLFVLLLGIGVFVRVWRVPELPRGLYHDGAMNAVEALSLLRTGQDHLGTPWPLHFDAWGNGQMSVLLSYATIPFFWLFGVSRLTIRLPLLLTSIVALPVMWDFARRMLGKRFALLVLGMVSICPWQIVQARWALDCNMMAHILLFSVYLLYLGLERKPLLYVSMLFFGLTMYTYGVALYTVPVLLIAACAYLLRQRRIRWREAATCAVIYLAVSAPFFIIMAINALELDTMRLGPFTLQRFYGSKRASDILLFSSKPVHQFMDNLQFFIQSTIGQNEGDGIAAYIGTRTLYAFSAPIIFVGVYLLWRARRACVGACGEKTAQEKRTGDGLSLVLFWLGAMVVCSILTNYTSSQRSNAIFYPLIFCLCYALYQTVRRVRGFAPVIVLVYALGFAVFMQGYFYDASHITRTAAVANSDLYGALQEVRETDCDRFYICVNEVPKQAEAVAIVAHEIDGEQLRGEKQLTDAQGAPWGFYGERYVYTDFEGFTPNPQENAAYVIRQKHRALFDPAVFIIQDFELYAAVYPRTGAQE